jgi:hypothetical protein
MLMHFYGYPDEAAILRLTPHQFNDRMNDVVEIHNQMQGEGKGRIRRDKKQWREWFRRNKKRPPRGYK